MGDTSFRLLPDFVGRAMVVSLPVGGVRILVGIVIKIGMLRVEFARHADGAVGSIGRVGVNDVRAVGVQNAFALGRKRFRACTA